MFNIGDLVKSEVFGIGRVTKVVTEEEDENDIYPIEVWFDSRYELDEDYEFDCYTAEGWFYTSEVMGDADDVPPQHKITKIKIKGFKNG